MTSPWIPSLYRTHDVQTAAPAPETVPDLLEAVKACSLRLESEPYNPSAWTERAKHYLHLNYPELAVGDAYKAKLLLERADAAAAAPASQQEHVSKPSSEGQIEHPGPAADDESLRTRAYTILGQALYDCHCHWECFEFWLAHAQLKQYPSICRLAFTKANALKQLLAQKRQAAAPYGGSAQQQRDRLRDGSVVTVRYPWTEQRHVRRTAEVVEGVNEELKGNVQPPACCVEKSSLAPLDDVDVDVDVDMLGVFATRFIRKGECILIDRTTTAAVSSPPSTPHCLNCYDAPLSSPVEASCCSAVFCSNTCHALAMGTYHRVLCGQDFTWLQHPAAPLVENASPMRPILMLRFLALSIQAGPSQHPLSHPLIARLQPLANRGHLDVFTLHESVALPLQILTQLGIDIFSSDTRFSTSTLHSIWTRLANNKAGSYDPGLGFVDEITPLLPLFNHSCAPNVEYKKEAGTSTIRFFTLRDIEKGEEVFDSYLDVEDCPRAERVRRLWPWFERECLCARCKRGDDEDEEV